MEDSDILYQELKLKLKTFELKFIKKNQRKPTKEDIALDSEISKVYGYYWKLHKKQNSTIKTSDKSDEPATKTRKPSKEIDIWKVNTKSAVKQWSGVSNSSKESLIKGYAAKLWKNSSSDTFESLKVKPKGGGLSEKCEPTPKLTEKATSNIDKEIKLNNVVNVIQNSTISTKEDEFPSNIFKKTPSFIRNKPFSSVTKKLNLYGDTSHVIQKTYDLNWLEKCEKINREPDEKFSEIVDSEPHECDTKPLHHDSGIHDSNSEEAMDTDNSEKFEENTIKYPNVDNKNSCMENSVSIKNPTQQPDPSNEPQHPDPSKEPQHLDPLKISVQENTTEIQPQIEPKPENTSNKRPLEPEESSEPASVFDFLGESTPKQPNKRPKLDPQKTSKPSNTPKPTKSKSNSTANTSNQGSTKIKPKGNFVRLNMKKKCFARGKGHRNLPHKYKMMKYKKRQSAGTGKCFKCGEAGHWANKCTFEMDGGEAANLETEENQSGDVIDNPQLPEDISNITVQLEPVPEPKFEFSSHPQIKPSIIQPIYNQESLQENSWETEEVLNGLKKMGHKKFRDFQEKAVMRILCGQSTLLVLPTGSGKSLCYQLPAYLYGLKEKCITLVVSPLVSLMEDQVKGLPKFLQSVFLHSGMTPNQRQKSIELVKEGNVRVLLLSPEFMLSSHGYLMSFLPPIAFVCIDEAHCLSEWSHNFRPSYLQLVKVIKEQMGVRCILALTATATKRTIQQIKDQIGLSRDDSVIGQTAIPENLHLSVSCDTDKDAALLRLLDEEIFLNGSIIVYCTRREETERVSTRIRIKYLDDSQKPGCSKGQKECHEVSPYHAGLSAGQRRSIQKKFMSGKMKVVVATVAFGMGLNKADVRGIIHFNMPKSFESYVQEVGRAGRDGLPAHCHLFLDPEGQDFVELRRHIYGNSLDRHVARKLLNHVFKPCKCTQECPGHNAAIPVQPLVTELDLKEENITTLLCYLELHPKKWVEVMAPTMATCTIRCYQGHQQLEKITKSCEPVAVGRRLSKERNDNKPKNWCTFNYVAVASEKNWNPLLVRRGLKQLEFANTGGNVHRSGVMVQFSDLSFHVKRKGNYTDEEKDQMLNCLYEKVVSLENRQLNQLSHVFHTFTKHSETTVKKCLQQNVVNSNGIKSELMKYFNAENLEDYEMNTEEVRQDPDNISELRRNVRALVTIHHEHVFTGRQVAQIFYGIGSPKFPAEVWGRARQFWRSHLDWEFNKIISVANEEIVSLKC